MVICAECKHSVVDFGDGEYLCLENVAERSIVIGRSPITGAKLYKNNISRTTYFFCSAINKNGDCKDFVPRNILKRIFYKKQKEDSKNSGNLSVISSDTGKLSSLE